MKRRTPKIDWKALCHDVGKRMKNYAVGRKKLARETLVGPAAVNRVLKGQSVDARDFLLLARWVKSHPYRYLRTPAKNNGQKS